jgi:hypothetical protein
MEGTIELQERKRIEAIEAQATEKKAPLVIPTRAYGTKAAKEPLGPMTVRRREPREQDVQIEILYCGICHSDIHTARNEWQNTVYPCVPGHEIIGRVVKTGRAVKKFKEGDIAGCRLPGGFVPPMRELSRRSRTILRKYLNFYL